MTTPNGSRLIEAEMPELVTTLVKKQLEVLAEGSELSRHRKRMGELKKERDGIIAEITRAEINVSAIELPLGLRIDEGGYVVSEDEEDGGQEE